MEPHSSPPTLAEAGIDKKLSSRAQKMAAGQKAAAADKLLPYFKEKAQERRQEAGGWRGNQYQKAEAVSADRREAPNYDPTSPPKPKPSERKAAAQAAKAVGASARSVERYKRIKAPAAAPETRPAGCRGSFHERPLAD